MLWHCITQQIRAGAWRMAKPPLYSKSREVCLDQCIKCRCSSTTNFNHKTCNNLPNPRKLLSNILLTYSNKKVMEDNLPISHSKFNSSNHLVLQGSTADPAHTLTDFKIVRGLIKEHMCDCFKFLCDIFSSLIQLIPYTFLNIY